MLHRYALHTHTVDLLGAKADVIANQCNCITTTPYEVSTSTSDRFPYLDLYKEDQEVSELSNRQDKVYLETCVSAKLTPGLSGPIIAFLMGQIAPGKARSRAKYSLRPKDHDPAARQKSFKSALHQLADMSVDSIGLGLRNLGYGLARGLTGQPILSCS